MNQDNDKGDIFNITSNNQIGGITAGIVNIFQKARIEFSEENKNKSLKVYRIKTIQCIFHCKMGEEVS